MNQYLVEYHEAIQKLDEIPGGHQSAESILAETGPDMSHFPTAKHYPTAKPHAPRLPPHLLQQHGQVRHEP